MFVQPLLAILLTFIRYVKLVKQLEHFKLQLKLRMLVLIDFRYVKPTMLFKLRPQ